MGRKLSTTELRAVNRLEGALASIPATLAVHFNEAGFMVFDREVFNDENMARDRLWMKWASSDQRLIRCRYDVGSL